MNIAEDGQYESKQSILPKILYKPSGMNVSPSDLKLKISSKYGGRVRRMSQPDIQISPKLRNMNFSNSDEKGDDSSIQVDSKSISINIKTPRDEQAVVFNSKFH